MKVLARQADKSVVDTRGKDRRGDAMYVLTLKLKDRIMDSVASGCVGLSKFISRWTGAQYQLVRGSESLVGARIFRFRQSL